MSAYKRILVPTDGTKLSLKAAKEAASLARDMHAEITAVYVMAPWTPPLAIEGAPLPAAAFDERAYLQSTRALAGEALEQVSAAAAAAHVKCEKLAVTDEQPWKGIVKAARAQNCDLIVMASHGRTGIAGVLLGSETRKVLAHATKPVLVCH